MHTNIVANKRSCGFALNHTAKLHYYYGHAKAFAPELANTASKRFKAAPSQRLGHSNAYDNSTILLTIARGICILECFPESEQPRVANVR